MPKIDVLKYLYDAQDLHIKESSRKNNRACALVVQRGLGEDPRYLRSNVKAGDVFDGAKIETSISGWTDQFVPKGLIDVLIKGTDAAIRKLGEGWFYHKPFDSHRYVGFTVSLIDPKHPKAGHIIGVVNRKLFPKEQHKDLLTDNSHAVLDALSPTTLKRGSTSNIAKLINNRIDRGFLIRFQLVQQKPSKK
jgi:hypothetical protein